MGLRRVFSRLWIRLFAFNALLVFVPVLGMLFLGSFESQLLRAQERTMVQEGRLLAAALSAGDALSADAARTIMKRLGGRHETRLRVIGLNGTLLADSVAFGPRREDSAAKPSPSQKQTWLYRVGSFPFRLFHRLREPAMPEGRDRYDSEGILQGPEIQAALEGRYGATTRVSSGSPPTVRLYSAIPILREDRVEGVVLVSQSTYRIFQILYGIRLGVFRVFLASLAVALLISVLVAMTIARPISRLKNRAEELLDRRGRLRGSFLPGNRRDEIGDLQGALAELTGRLERGAQSMESFAADLSHEFKNPLASIRAATEVALESDDAGERARLLELIQREISRLERLLSSLREISRLDLALETEDDEVLDLGQLLTELVESFRIRAGQADPTILLTVAGGGLKVRLSADRLTQALEKILDNAISFSPMGGKVHVRVFSEGENAVLQIEDEGPGIAEDKLEKVFDRFYTSRRDGEEGHHGLGLALSRSIIEASGGKLRALQKDSAGALIEMSLPLVDG